MKNIEDKASDITSVATDSTLNAKRNELKKKIPNITNLVIITTFTAVENKIPNVSNKKTDYNTKIKKKLKWNYYWRWSW